MGFKLTDIKLILNTIDLYFDIDGQPKEGDVTKKSYELLKAQPSDIHDIFKKCNNLSFIELGEEELKVLNQELNNALVQPFTVNPPRIWQKRKERMGYWAKDYLKTIFKNVISTDVRCKCPNTLRVDLGRSLMAQNLTETFNILNNNGTTEHVGEFPLNRKTSTYNPQYYAFENIHNLVKTDGIIFHSVPFTDTKHGAFQYAPKFFNSLATICNYDVIYNFTEARGDLVHTYCALVKKEDNKFIDLKTFEKIPGLSSLLGF
tara:strand:+ start:322 stop:1104 length:783 start_codon:yes stop_codon:yes gene_type:complete